MDIPVDDRDPLQSLIERGLRGDRDRVDQAEAHRPRLRSRDARRPHERESPRNVTASTASTPPHGRSGREIGDIDRIGRAHRVRIDPAPPAADDLHRGCRDSADRGPARPRSRSAGPNAISGRSASRSRAVSSARIAAMRAGCSGCGPVSWPSNAGDRSRPRVDWCAVIAVPAGRRSSKSDSSREAIVAPRRAIARQETLRPIHAVDDRSSDRHDQDEETPERAVAAPDCRAPDEILQAVPGQHVMAPGQEDQERDQNGALPAHESHPMTRRSAGPPCPASPERRYPRFPGAAT